MGPIGVPEMVGILVIALLLFGPKKLPELGRTLGKAITEFRRASNELKSTFETHLSDLEKEVQLEKTTDYTPPYSSPVTYPYPHDEYGSYNPEPETASSSLAESVNTNTTSTPPHVETHSNGSHLPVGEEKTPHPKTSQTDPVSPASMEESHRT